MHMLSGDPCYTTSRCRRQCPASGSTRTAGAVEQCQFPHQGEHRGRDRALRIREKSHCQLECMRHRPRHVTRSFQCAEAVAQCQTWQSTQVCGPTCIRVFNMHIFCHLPLQCITRQRRPWRNRETGYPQHMQTAAHHVHRCIRLVHVLCSVQKVAQMARLDCENFPPRVAMQLASYRCRTCN